MITSEINVEGKTFTGQTQKFDHFFIVFFIQIVNCIITQDFMQLLLVKQIRFVNNDL